MIYTSYYAVMGKIPNNVMKVSISKGIPYWYQGKSYYKLAPRWETVKKYKDGGSWDEYVKEYYETVLDKLNPVEVYSELLRLNNGGDVVLLCYEKASDNCHRHIIADWLNKAGVACNEYKFN